MSGVIYVIGMIVSFFVSICAWKIWIKSERKKDPEFKTGDGELGLIFATSIILSLFSWASIIGVCIFLSIIKYKEKFINFFNSEKNCIDIIKRKK